VKSGKCSLLEVFVEPKAITPTLEIGKNIGLI
jgi:hypothetical protein